jgi:hypothetical protein
MATNRFGVVRLGRVGMRLKFVPLSPAPQQFPLLQEADEIDEDLWFDTALSQNSRPFRSFGPSSLAFEQIEELSGCL